MQKTQVAGLTVRILSGLPADGEAFWFLSAIEEVCLLRDSFRLARTAVKRRYVDTVARVVANRLTAQMDFYQDWAAAQTWR